MTQKVLADILVRHANCRREADVLHASKEQELGLLAALGNQTLAIERVVRIDLEGEVLVALTARRERYVLAYEDVRAVRVGADSHAGFGD